MTKIKKCDSHKGTDEYRHCNSRGETMGLLDCKCSRCEGIGTCPACNGSGEVEVDDK